MKKINISDVKKSFNSNADANFPICARLIGRPLGTIIAVPAHNLGVSANQITFFRIILYFFSVYLLYLPGYLASLVGGIGLILSFVFDYVDGHLARINDEASHFGKFFDGIGDYIFPVFLALPVGIKLHSNHNENVFIILSLICCFIVLFNRVLRERLRFFNLNLPKQNITINSANKTLKKIKNAELFFAIHAANARIFCIFILFIPDFEYVYFFTMAGTQILFEILWGIFIFAYSFHSLNHWKKSASAN